jgi:uncharacterized protein (DUF697 family)/tellurite resistance protein
MDDTLTELEQRAVMTLALMAAFADGQPDETERAEVARAATSLSGGTLDVADLYQRVVQKTVALPEAAAALTRPQVKQLAYELCTGVCTADGVQNDAERTFLAELQRTLGLSGDAASSAARVAAQANAVAAAPLDRPSSSEPQTPVGQMSSDEQDRLILHYAILNGALELLPESVSTMAIVPLQMKMVYRIGQSYGVELDRSHIKEFLGTAGIGMASQFIEQIGTKLVGSVFGRGILGSLLGGLAEQSVSSGFSFATTYALGRLAVRYYASGRTLSAQMLKDTYESLLREARGLQGHYLSAIQEKARTINVSELLQDVAR